jgi:hypothetical protein
MRHIGIERTANVIWEGDENFDFRILPDPGEIETAIRAKAREGFSALATSRLPGIATRALPRFGSVSTGCHASLTILKEILRGAAEQGAETRLIHLNALNMKGC